MVRLDKLLVWYDGTGGYTTVYGNGMMVWFDILHGNNVGMV